MGVARRQTRSTLGAIDIGFREAEQSLDVGIEHSGDGVQEVVVLGYREAKQFLLNE